MASTGFSDKPIRWAELIKKHPEAKKELKDFMDDEVDVDLETKKKREIKCKNLILKKY